MVFRFIRRHPAWSWSLGLILLIFALSLIVLPKLVHLGLERWLERQGRISVDIENVDFSPFTGKLVVHTLLAQREAAPGRIRWEVASLNIDWWPLLEQRLKLESLELRDAIVTIRREPENLYIGGFKIRTGGSAGKTEEEQNGWQFGFEGVALKNVRVRFLEEGFEKEFLIREAHIGSMADWNPESPGALRARIQAAEGSLALDGQARPFADRPAFDVRLNVDAVNLGWLQPWLENTPVTVQQALFYTDLTVSGRYLPDPERLHVQLDGSARLEQIRAQVQQVDLDESDLSWEGHLELAAPRDAPPLVVAEGTLQNSNLNLLLKKRQFAIQTESAMIDLSYAMGTQEVPPKAAFLLTLSGTTGKTSLSDAGKRLVLAFWHDLQVENLHLVGSRSYSLARLTAADLRLLERSEKEPLPFFLQASRLEATGLQAGEGAPIGAQSLKAQKLRLLLVRTKEGIDFSPWSLPLQENALEKKEKDEGIPNLRLGLLDIGRGSRVLIRDRSLQPTLVLDLEPLLVHVENLETTEKTGKPARFDITVEANGHPLSIEGEARISGEEISTSGQVDLREWPVSLVQPYLGEKAGLENGLLSLNSRLDGDYNFTTNRLKLKLEGSAQLTDVYGTMGGMRLQRLSVDWRGQAAVETIAGGGAAGEEEEPIVTARGEVQVPRFGLVLPEAQLRLEGETVRMHGDFAMGTPAVPKGASFLLQAEGNLASLQAEDREKELNLASLQNIQVAGGRMAGPDTMSADRVKVSGVQLLERPGETEAGGSHFLSAASAVLEKPQTTGGELTAAEFEVQGLEGILVREADGDFPFGQWLPGEKEEKENEPLRLAIALLKINGESRLRFIDRTVEPYVDLALQPFDARVQDLNTVGDKPGHLAVDGKFARYSNLRLNGTILSLAGKPSMELLLEFESLSLPKLTGYTEKFFGYRAQAGNLDLKADIDVQEGKLDAQTTWKLTKLNLDAIDPEKREETKSFLGFSLKTGVSLLRDGDGVVTLNIPVTGELTSPDFRFNQVVQKAILKGIRSAALAYFSPLGLVAKLGKELLIDKVMELRFKPVLFKPGETQLSAPSRRYLDQVVRRLQERPQVTIVVCGVVVPKDIAVMRSQDPSASEILALAKRRGENVRTYLVDQGIAPDRLVQCATEMDRSEDGEPRAEIGI